MFGWTVADIPLFVALPVLLGTSAFFSGTETAFFGMPAHQASQMKQRSGSAARAAAALIRQPQMLLITLLLGNLFVNVLYFVVSSVLLLRMDVGVTGPAASIIPAAIGIGILILIILVSEVAPKLIASRIPARWALFAAVPMFLLFNVLLPLRVAISSLVIGPVIRLLGPSDPPARLSASDLLALLDVASDRGDILQDEYRLLQDVVALSRLKVRDVMWPRVRVKAIALDDDDRDSIKHIARGQYVRHVPVYRQNLDDVVGLLDLRRFLLDDSISIEDGMIPPTFIPEVATLDHLVEHFREAHTKTVVAVDEFGQTAGIVTLRSMVNELMGMATDPDESSMPPIMIVGLGRWRVGGFLNVHDLAEAFEMDLGEPRVSTVAGLMTEHLGRLGEVGDSIQVGRWKLTVRETKGPQVTAVDVEAARKGKPSHG